ncbi:ABC transporter permease [Nonomuraea turkmeniaca]|uniref:ABC transporter permease n=1 Tax=Nonomuraea turkmeniaca TaxID=103838 RepID=A0A5S4FKK2_9ACTN|nr:ABC transporter permease [Nonomuraea turkmeniaca]TMR20751.1 ABC transporter permease [Nonomuraea turkmeniaca]
MPKLIWREPIETTTITNRPPGGETDDASALETVPQPRQALEPKGEPRRRVITLGDIAGRESGGLVVLLVAIGALTLASDEFLTGNNLSNLARQVAIFGIIAVGQLLVILTAGIDLSVGSILGLSGASTAQLLVAGVPILPSILLGVGIGTALGIVNGLLVTRALLPPFIATLGMLGIARGMVLVSTDAQTIQGVPEAFQVIANGTVLGVPNLLIIAAVVTAVMWFVLTRTVFGRYIYAVGSNPESARLAGVPVRMVTISVYMISGLLAGLGGVLLASRLGAGIPTAGTGFELSAIAACVIGGASLFGAKGSAIGAATGALIMGVLNNGGNLLAINAFYLQIAIGVLILVAVGFDQLNTRRSAASGG